MDDFLDTPEFATVTLTIAGLGLVVYSPFAAAGIAENERFLETSYWEPADVSRHVMAGTLAGFGTGSPGTYVVRCLTGVMNFLLEGSCAWWVRLALEVRDRSVCIRDLYDFHRWQPVCPPAQRITLADGFYRLSVGTSLPASGHLGDGQEILVLFEPSEKLPRVVWDTVPFLGDDED